MFKTLNRAGAILLVVFIITSINCERSETPGTDSRKFFANESFSFTVNVTDQATLRIEGITGTVDVTGKSGINSIVISGEKRVDSGSKKEAEEHLRNLKVDVQELTDEVFIKTIQPENTRRANYVIDYAITVPDDMEALVGNVTGRVMVRDVVNDVSVNSITGDVSVQKIKGNTSVNLVTGAIDADATMPADGEIVLKTVTGTINLKIPKNTSAEISAKVTTGRISATNLECEDEDDSANFFKCRLDDGQGNISLRTVTGSISISGL
jgi:DUF4097 and DUF4098 domain-containing protein YvlB